MSATSSDLQLDNENSYSSRTKGGTEKDKKNTTNWENGKRSSSNSKSETRSVSSKYDDKSEHFERLLRESQQHLCNRDTIIDMLQKQLKRIEELYKKTLNQQQDIRQKYANVVLELSRLRVICDQLKTENSTLSRANEETTRRYRYEREDLQDELDTWRQEYDQLVRAINNMEKNTIVMKDILYSDDNYHQQILNGSHVEQLLEQYKQIQGALVVQNNKLDKFLEKFHLIGDGGCTIVRSLEGVRCIGMVQSRSLSSIVPDRLRSSREPEQTLTSEVRRPESRRRSEIPPPIVRNDYYNMERQSQKVDGSMRSHQVSIWHEEGKCPSVKVDDIIQTDSHSSICCVNMPPMMLESSRQINSVRSCCEEVLIVPEKFMQMNYLTKTPYLIANECLQTCSCSTSETSCCSELISPPVATAEAIQTGPSCESISDVIPSPVFTIDLATSPGSICVSIESAPEDTSPCSRSCCDLKIDADVTQNAIQRIETAMQTESIHESICSVPQEKPLLTSTHSSRDTEVVPIPIVSREIAAQTSSISGGMCSISRGKTPPIPYILEIMPPRPILKEKTAISGSIRKSTASLSKEMLTKTHNSNDSKSAQTAAVSTETGAKTSSSSENICSFPQRKIPPCSHSGNSKISMSSMISLETAAKLESLPESPNTFSKEEPPANTHSIRERELEPTFVGTAAHTESIPKNSFPGKSPTSLHSFRVSKFVMYEEATTQTVSVCKSICNISQEKPSSSSHSHYVSKMTQTMIEVIDQDELKEGYIPTKPVKLRSMVTRWFPPPATTETGTSPPLHIHFLPEMHATESSCRNNCIRSKNMASITAEEITQTESFVGSSCIHQDVQLRPLTVEEASQTESICRDSSTLSDKVPSIITVEEVTQTVSIVGHSYTAPKVISPPQTIQEASQTESTCRDSCTFTDVVPSVMTMEETTQTVSIATPPTIEEASQTESTYRNSCTLSDKVSSTTTVEEVSQTVSIVGHSYTAPEVISPSQTIQQASQTESTCRDSCTLTHIVPSVMTMEETTQTVSIATPPTIEEASQTESTYRNSCTLSDKVSSTTTVEEVTQTVSVVGDSYTALKVISPPQTIQEASQTESTCRDSCTLTDIVPSVMTMEETTQTVSIATPPTIEETSQTESTYRNSCTLSDKVSSTTTVEEVTQTVSVVGDSYTAPKVISPPQTIQEASQTESMCRDSCTLTYIVPSVMTIEETTQTVSIATPPTIEEASQTESTCRDSCTLSDKLSSTKTVEEVIQMVLIVGNSCTAPEAIPPTLTIEEASQTVSIGGDGCISPEAISPVTAEKATQPDSIGEITTGTDTINASLISGLLLTAEEATQTATMGQICVTTEESILAPCITTSFFPETILLANAEKSTQTVSIGQITIGTSTSASSSGESLLTIEKFTQTTPIGQSAFLPEIRPATVEESTQTMSIDQISAATYLSSESILTTEESTQTASIRQIITEICASLPSLHLGSLPEVISSESVEEATNTELDGCSTCAISEVIPPPSSIGELAQSVRPTPEQQEQSVWVLPEAEDEATQIEIFSVPASIQTDGRASTYIDSHKFGVSIETQTTADQSTQTLNLECIDCCTETELQLDFDLYVNRKLITCHKRSKSNQISRRSSAASCDEQELRTCCFCDDISLTVKPEATDKAICTDFLDSGDGSLLAENERLHQLILLKDLTIKRLQEESSLDSNKLKEVLVEKQKLQDENNALKQDLANIEDELEGLKKKLADVGQEISVTGNGKDYYISETNVLLNEYEASLQELNQKYASAITENQSLTEEVAVLMEQVSFLNETIKQHKEQASLCKLQLENMTEKAKELEDSIKDLEEQKEFTSNPSDNIDELNPALHELTEQYELLKEENESLLEYNKEILLLKKKNSNLLHEIDAKDIVIDELQGHMAELQKELDSVKEEMESNNENAKEEMDKLIQVCSELEQKLETAKELLEKEVSLMDEEVSASLGPYNEHTDDYLQKELDKKAKQLQKAKEEMESVKDNFEEEILKLNAKNTLLQLQLEKEQLDHQREIETIEEKLAQCDKEYVSTVVSCSDIGSSDSSTTSSELTSLLEECVEKNKRLHEELRTCKEQIKSLRESGKECGLLKAENMKLKVQISALQKQLAEMKDVEEKLKQLKHEKEELIVKVKYLEKQLAISRCRCERAKKPPPCLDPIKEETSQRPITAVAPKPKVPCCPCSQKKDHALLTLAAPCANNVNTNPSPDTDNTVTRKDSQICGALGTLNLRLASINRMEGQIDQMIMSVRRQNQRMNECNFSRFQSDKDIKGCLSNLRHKREQLMGSLNKFKQELTVFECKTKGRVCNCPKQRNPP